jgi:hypothetical protein
VKRNNAYKQRNSQHSMKNDVAKLRKREGLKKRNFFASYSDLMVYLVK